MMITNNLSSLNFTRNDSLNIPDRQNKKEIKIHAVLGKDRASRSFFHPICNLLKGIAQLISKLFFTIFCCCKKDRPHLVNAHPRENPKFNMSEYPGEKIHNGVGQQDCREILKGIRVNIDLVPMVAGGGKQGKILMPHDFANDLHRLSSLYLNGKQIFSQKGHTVEMLDHCCNEMFKILGKNVSIALSRLLNQAGFAKIYVHFMEEKIQQGYEFLFLQQSVRNQCDIEVEEERVILKIKYAFACRTLNQGLIEENKNRVPYIGMEAKYSISLKELEELGAFSREELKNLEIDNVAPSLETTYTYTKACKTETEAYQAIGIRLFEVQ